MCKITSSLDKRDGASQPALICVESSPLHVCVAEEKLAAVEAAHEAESQGKPPPGGRSARDLEEELTVDIQPDEVRIPYQLEAELSLGVCRAQRQVVTPLVPHF